MIEINPFGAGMEKMVYQPYDNQLPLIFDEIRKLIRENCPDAIVEHIGSSSIPGIGGRNVLDIAIPCPNKQVIDEITKRLIQIGFEESPFPHFLPLLVGATIWKDKKYYILLYVLPSNNKTFKDAIAFRNYMRQNPHDAQAYDELKKNIIKEGKTQADDYQNA